MRLGLIGLGRIGAFHAATLAASDAVDALVVHDPFQPAVDAVVARHGAGGGVTVLAADGPADVLAGGVDGVVIAAATDVHPELIHACLDAGLPTFCEKPVARDPRDGEEILRRVEETGVPVQIGYPRRFDLAFVEARRAVAAGELGVLHTVRSTTLDPAAPPDAYVRASGGIFRDCSVHDYDAVRFVTGEEVVSVYATGSLTAAAAPVFAECDDVDTAATVLTLASGALAVVSNSRYNPRGYDVRLELHGSRDSVGAGIEAKWPIRSTEPGTIFPGGTPHSFFMDRFAAAFRAELAAFTEVVAGTRESPCTVADAVEVGWIAEAADQSRRLGRPVEMSEIRTRKVHS